jgi:Protein of unknown function (DUF4079)
MCAPPAALQHRHAGTLCVCGVLDTSGSAHVSFDGECVYLLRQQHITSNTRCAPLHKNLTSSVHVQKRKELTQGNFKDRHHRTGSLLLGFGVVIAIEGCLNTYVRAGKLFPGPHLFAGATIVSLWAIAASLVPAMQKGNDTARYAHIGANTLNVALFAWQIPTGWAIVQKVFQFTTFP